MNTTGTPYFERQPLRDVVVWYGLRQGIEDDVLKEVAGNIEALDFDPAQADEFVAYAIETFFRDYGGHTLPDGSAAKLAIYFPQNDDLDELAPHVELAVARAGLPPTVILRNTARSTATEVDAFNRLNDPGSPHRVILLVNKGTEGWNCPSLFATALARKLRTSQNFVLQAASRCLRQVPGNDRPARIFLSQANRSALDAQLRETYGESLAQLDGQRRASQRTTIRLRKTDVPSIRLTMPLSRLERETPRPTNTLAFDRPPARQAETMTRTVLDIGLGAASRRVLRQVGDAVTIDSAVDVVSRYAAAAGLAANHRVEPWPILDALNRAYGEDDIPVPDLDALSAQLEAHLGTYREVEMHELRELAIVKPEGFATTIVDGEEVHEAEISYPLDKAHLVWGPDRIAENAGDYGFHYAPYNFDSRPEADFYERVLGELNLHPADIQDVYFTGAITDPSKTDIAFAYARDGREHWYTPDFAIHASGDRWMLVEIKMSSRRDDPVEGEQGVKANAIRRLEEPNGGRIVYRIVFADEMVPARDIAAVRDFLR